MKVASLAATVLFALFAFWQFNDPDALQWVVIYALAAVGSAAAYFGKLPRMAAVVTAVAALVYGLVLARPILSDAPDAVVSAEQMREMLGVFVVALWFHHVARQSNTPDA